MMLTGIYLERNGGPRLTAQQWLDGYALLDQTLSARGVTANWYIIAGENLPSKQRKVGSAAHRRRLAEGFEGVRFVGLNFTPPSSDAPAWDWTDKANLISGEDELSLSVMFDAARCPLGSGAFDDVLASLVGFADWDIGWALTGDRDRGFSFYLSGSGSGMNLSEEDERAILAWYRVHDGEERRRRLRDVFPVNILTDRQLDYPFRFSTLRGFIDADRDSTLVSLTSRLSRWTVRPEAVDRLRRELRGTGLLVAE